MSNLKVLKQARSVVAAGITRARNDKIQKAELMNKGGFLVGVTVGALIDTKHKVNGAVEVSEPARLFASDTSKGYYTNAVAGVALAGAGFMRGVPYRGVVGSLGLGLLGAAIYRGILEKAERDAGTKA